jgi:hypothetical protein
MLQPIPEGKAIVMSDTGWSHTFTFQLASSLIQERDKRPTPFTGTVAVELLTKSDAAAPPQPIPTAPSALRHQPPTVSMPC